MLICDEKLYQEKWKKELKYANVNFPAKFAIEVLERKLTPATIVQKHSSMRKYSCQYY